MPGGFGSTSHITESVHEMYVDPNGHRAYVAYTRGGLFILDMDTANAANSSIVKRQMYDSDKSGAMNVFSTLTPRFDWRTCHSAWPTDDRNYVFTTDEISPGSSGFAYGDSLQAPILKVWKTSDLDSASTTSLKGNYFVQNGEAAGLINTSMFDTTRPPNSIHQLHTRDGYAYVAHYTQGFRVLDISDPENLIEVAYYNVYDTLTTGNYSDSGNWGQGIYGVFPDAYRQKICYAGGGTDGLSIFKHYHETIADTIYSIKRVNLDGSFTITGDTYITAGTLVNVNNNSTLLFDAGRTLYVDGELWLNTNTFGANSRIVCRDGGKIVICPEAHVTGLHTMIIDSGGVLEVKTQSIVEMQRDGVIKIRGVMDAGLNGSNWARFDKLSSVTSWTGIVFDSIDIALSEQSTLSNLFVHGAKSGITTDHAQPTITNCELSDNDIGITVFSDSPFLSSNRIERNKNAGLLGYYMSTVVHDNRFNNNTNYGALLYHCGNLWTDNRVDSNGTYGVFGNDLYLPFNRYDGGSCDTTQGNSMRWNNAGVHIQHKSAPTFECDNSVHSNIAYDFILRDTSTVIGDGNYPDDVSMNVDVDALSVFSWSNPAGSETVLHKSNSTQTPVVQRQAIDPRYTLAFNQGAASKRLRAYTTAVAKYGEALGYAQRRWEAEQCLTQWQQSFMDATLNKPSNDAICVNPASAKAQYVNTLSAIRSSTAQPPWLRNTATEYLADYHAANRHYPEAVALYNNLAAISTTEPLIARRSHLALVILTHRGLKDWNGAYAIYEDIADLYPGSHEEVHAKIDLGLPLTEADSVTIRTLPGPSNEKARTAEIAEHEYAIDDIYPNPFNPTTSISFSMKDAGRVRLSVHDSRGVELLVLLDEQRTAGRHAVTFDAAHLSSGVYHCRMVAGGVTMSRTMTVVK
ncbi:MAG: T9SS type A sorting domain-containing protein [Bacteroidia bacterium]|nr:T9SS type A sorting domain-containing protein [Bacteroidia bacterium]